MGSVIWHVTMSLDGFIAGPDDAMDWVFEHQEATNALAEDVMRRTGAVLAGRRSYDVGAGEGQPAERRKVYGGAWTGPQFVLTHEPPQHEQDASITFVSGDVRGALAMALAAAEGKNVVVIGADVARQCIARGLVHEIAVHLAPVLLGEGVRLYGGEGAGQVELQRTSVEPCGALTNLRFRVLGTEAQSD
jgi:dihydrofolate reductase